MRALKNLIGSAVLTSSLFAATAGAASIGVSFQRNNVGVDSGSNAGLVPQQYFQNTSNNSGGETISGLVDSSNTTTSASLSYGGYSYGANYYGEGNNDYHLLEGFIEGGSFTVSSIPYASYNLIVYLNGAGNNRNGFVDATGGTREYFTTENANYGDPVVYSQGSTTANNFVAANYAEFDGLTSASVTASLSQDYPQPGIAGFQIVDTSPTPEPATLGVFALGGLGLLRRRRA